jgi:benzoate-CoA ligase
VFARLRQHQPTIFYGVPTLYAALLASPSCREARAKCACAAASPPARRCREQIGKRWTEHFGVDILDGIGSTEMLHIFLSNRPGRRALRHHRQAGARLPLRLVDDDGREVARGEQGRAAGCRADGAAQYWNNREKTRATFLGEWTRCGDKYIQDATATTSTRAAATTCSRSAASTSRRSRSRGADQPPAVLEAAVVGREDEDRLDQACGLRGAQVRPAGRRAGRGPAPARQGRSAPYKYPRWIEFVDELPKTATGKIQRFKLRART